jgi:hypothetical protein
MTTSDRCARFALIGFLAAVSGCGEGAAAGNAASAAGANSAGAAAGGALGQGGSAVGVAGSSLTGAGTATGGMAAVAGAGGTSGGAVGNGGASAGAGGAVMADPVVCGDATCDSSESCTSCAADCGACGSLPAFGNTDIHPQKSSNHATELQAQSPALNLQDLWQIEKHDKLDGKIARVSYVYLHTMMLGDTLVGDHHAFTGFFLAMASYSALGKISKNAYLDEAHPDFIASDDGKGHFGVMLWNTSEASPMSGQKRTISNVSVGSGAKLYALRMAAWGALAGGDCKPLAEQTWVSVNQQGTTFELTANAIAPLEAVYLSTQPCKNFVN